MKRTRPRPLNTRRDALIVLEARTRSEADRHERRQVRPAGEGEAQRPAHAGGRAIGEAPRDVVVTVATT